MTDVPKPGDKFELFGVEYQVYSLRPDSDIAEWKPYSDWFWTIEAFTTKPIAGVHGTALFRVPAGELTH